MSVRRPWAVAVVIGVTAASLLGFGQADAASIHYVALGDSYSSGEGAGSYTGGDCDRSPNAYSALWANANHPSSYVSLACAGATTTDVINDQIPSLPATTTLVSITIGGNDQNFAGIMLDCNLRGTSTCVNEINTVEADARANLPGKLVKLYAAIKGKAPNAKIVVLGYPRFYDLSKSCIGLSQTSRTAIDGGIDLLDSITSTAAQTAGATYADVRSAFGSHEICDSNRWLHSVNLLDVQESYHPTADGQKYGYLPVFSAKA